MIHFFSDPNQFTVHLKLHPGIIYSHSASKALFPPKLVAVADAGLSGSGVSEPILSFSLATGSGDWRYPFDLCGSVYRSKTIATFLASFKAAEMAVSNPNKLEFFGNKVYWAQSKTRETCCLCCSVPKLSVVTVNRVQQTYKVPIYETDEGSVQQLNSLIHQQNFDFPLYQNQTYLSVHIGDIFLAGSQASVVEPTKKYCISVVLPVYNGAEYLPLCLDSLLAQDCDVACYEVLVVDDGSTDSSLEVIESYKSAFATRGIEYRVLSKTHEGLVAALNYGLDEARGEFIARIDADDICLPHRLRRQSQYLSHHPEIIVLGAQALLFDKVSQRDQKLQFELKKGHPEVAYGIYTEPNIVSYEMQFRCAVLHPTVMFRRDMIKLCGNYGGNVSGYTSIEDYRLWMDILSRSVSQVQKYVLLIMFVRCRFGRCITNLPDVLVYLRQHDTSKSHREFQLLGKESNELREWHLQNSIRLHTQSNHLSVSLSSHVPLALYLACEFNQATLKRSLSVEEIVSVKDILSAMLSKCLAELDGKDGGMILQLLKHLHTKRMARVHKRLLDICSGDIEKINLIQESFSSSREDTLSGLILREFVASNF